MPVCGTARRHRFGLGGTQHSTANAVLLCHLAPVIPVANILLRSRGIDQPAGAKPYVHPDVVAQRMPALQGVQNKRNFPLVAVKLTAPAPVTAGLLCADKALFDHGNPIAFFGQLPTGRCTCNPGTDNHHIHRIGEMCTVLNKPERCGHRL